MLHADHHYGSAIGQKPSLMSSVSATTWDSTNDRSLSTKSTKSTKTRKSAARGSGARKSPFKTSRAEAQREREKSVRVFRYGTPPKNIYAKNDGERVTQREWDNCRISVDDYGFSGSPSRGAAVPLYDRVSVDDYSAPGGSPDPRPDSPG